MKMTLKEANERYIELSKMAERTFPAKLGFAIASNIDALGKEFDRIEQERVKLCKLYAEKDENGKPKMLESVVNGRPTKNYDISDQNVALLSKDLEDLMETEVDVEIRTVEENIIEKCESGSKYSVPSVREIRALTFMIE